MGKETLPPESRFFERPCALLHCFIWVAGMPCSARYSLITWPRFGILKPYLSPRCDQLTCWSGCQVCASSISCSLSICWGAAMSSFADRLYFLAILTFFPVNFRTWSNLFQLSLFCKTSMSPSLFMSPWMFSLISLGIFRFLICRALELRFVTRLERGVSSMTYWTDRLSQLLRATWSQIVSNLTDPVEWN